MESATASPSPRGNMPATRGAPERGAHARLSHAVQQLHVSAIGEPAEIDVAEIVCDRIGHRCAHSCQSPDELPIRGDWSATSIQVRPSICNRTLAAAAEQLTNVPWIFGPTL